MAHEFTPEQRRAAILVIQVIADIIRTTSPTPAGHVYAGVMEHMSLQTFGWIIEGLVEAKVIRKEGHLLIWIGLTKENA